MFAWGHEQALHLYQEYNLLALQKAGVQGFNWVLVKKTRPYCKEMLALPNSKFLVA